MILPTDILAGDDRHIRTVMDHMNHVTNIIWQSERSTFKDCETIMEQIIMFLFEKGYFRRET